ncbi:MAG: hypothetical protein ACTSUT_16130, partial [Promethearchaeota archaeon]
MYQNDDIIMGKLKKEKIKGLATGPIKICPVCGFSFKIIDPTTGKKVKACPMCKHEFFEPNIL